MCDAANGFNMNDATTDAMADAMADAMNDDMRSEREARRRAAAARALREAEERRAKGGTIDGAKVRAKELGGRAGPDPVRHGDWENGGIASDF